MGIFLGWIVRRRWLTLGATLLCVIGLFVIPRLPAPINLIWVVLPGVLFAAISYEGSGFLLGPSLYLRTRVLYATCAGTAVLVLAVGVTFAGSNPYVLLGAVVVFIVIWFAGSVPMLVKYRAVVRGRHDASVTH
jgi:hypothetical protein